MGQARIVSGGPNALYNVTLIKSAAKSATEIPAITTRLAELIDLIDVADSKIVTELAALNTLQNALGLAMYLYDGTSATLKAITDAQAAVLSKQTDVIKAQSALSLLKAEEESIKKRQAMLIAAMAIERRPAWCTDLTEDLTAGAVVGTMEMNGVDDEIIIAPGGKVSESIGLLQHVGVSTGAAVFCNRARLPAWQKWKPTYRVGRIITINYESNICDVGIEEQYSEEQGLKINQPGTLYTALKSAVSGWDDFALQNPSFALVTNTSDSTIPSTDQLLADLNTVNNYVNNRNRYTLDEQQYGKLENWTIMADGGSGDCEDYALTKASKLLDLGYPASALHIEVGMYSGEGHAWLVVQTDNGDLALDNRYQSVMNNSATPYYARQRQIGMEWKVRGVLLADVPIEYMNGDNASAFLVDDMVVVQFVGQNWNNPKVIGFEMNPKGRALYIQTDTSTYTNLRISKYGLTGISTNDAYFPSPTFSSGGTTFTEMWRWPYSIFNGEIYIARPAIQGPPAEDTADTLIVNVYNLKTKLFARKLSLKFYHGPALYEGETTAAFQWTPTPLGGRGIGSMIHSSTGAIYISATWMTFTGFVYWTRSGIYAFDHLTGAEKGYYHKCGARDGLTSSFPAPLQQSWDF